LVDSVYLFGAPVEISAHLWLKISTVVSGRIVNGYSKSDWFLHFLHRSDPSNSSQIAGLSPIELSDLVIPGYSPIENIDFSQMILSHVSWKESLPELLEIVRFERSPSQCYKYQPDQHQHTFNLTAPEANLKPDLAPIESIEVLFDADLYSESINGPSYEQLPAVTTSNTSTSHQNYIIFSSNPRPSSFIPRCQTVSNGGTLTYMPRSLQLSPASANEPEALVLSPLPREVSLDVLAEDEQERRQAEDWVGADIEM
jgi:hypothetical protein